MDSVKQEEEKAITPTTTTTVGGVDWLELPEHITSIILSKLLLSSSSIYDSARSGAVCVEWQSILHSHINKNCQQSLNSPQPQLPVLMIPTRPEKKNMRKRRNDGSSSTISCSFYRVTDGKIFNALMLTMPRDRYVRGSGHGWLITVDHQYGICYSVQLINPFFYPETSTKEIKLPLLIITHHPGYRECVSIHLRKVVLSANPISNPKDFIVMAIFGENRRLAFCKSGDKAWTFIRDDMRGYFDDVIYYDDTFYAVHHHGTVVVCNVENCTTVKIMGPPVTEFESNKKYLVISSGKLLQVHRNVDEGGITVGFKVFKFHNPSQNMVWVEVNDLHGHVLFLGDNASISISASDFPGCKPNSIYYTDDNIELYRSDDSGKGPYDLGVYNLENGSFEKHYSTGVNVRIWPAPVWIVPTLQRSTTHTKFFK